MTVAFVSVDEFRTANPSLDLSNYSDTTLSGVLTRATARAENYLEYTLPYESIVDEKQEGAIDSFGDLVVFPRKLPLQVINSLQIVKGTFSATVDLSQSQYDIPSRKDCIVVAWDSIALTTFSAINYTALRYEQFFTKMSYDAGYQMSDRPQDIVDAIMLMAKDEVARSFNPAGAVELRQGAVTIKYANSSQQVDGKSDLVRDAEAILTTYKRVTGW